MKLWSLVTVLFIALHSISAESANWEEAENLFYKAEYKALKEAVTLLESDLRAAESAVVRARLSRLLLYIQYIEFQNGVRNKKLITESAEYLKSARQKQPGHIETVLSEAAYHIMQGDYTQADRTLDNYSGSTENPEFWYLKGLSTEGSLIDRDTTAGAHMQKSLDINPNFLFTLKDLFTFAIQSERYSLAEQYLKEIVSRSTEDKSLYFQGIYEYARNSNSEKLKSYMTSNPESIHHDRLNTIIGK